MKQMETLGRGVTGVLVLALGAGACGGHEKTPPAKTARPTAASPSTTYEYATGHNKFDPLIAHHPNAQVENCATHPHGRVVVKAPLGGEVAVAGFAAADGTSLEDGVQLTPTANGKATVQTLHGTKYTLSPSQAPGNIDVPLANYHSLQYGVTPGGEFAAIANCGQQDHAATDDTFGPGRGYREGD